MRHILRVRDVVSFLVFGTMIAFSLGYYGMLGVHVKPPDDRTNLSMAVQDVNGVVAGSKVLLRGVPVGKVLDVSTTVQASTIEFYIADGYRIPVDSEVWIENLSALGETYIGLVPRTEDGPILQDGQHIATEAIKQPASISELVTSVVRVLNQLDPEALERIIAEADAAMPDPAAVLPNISRASTLLRNTVAEVDAPARVLLDNFQTLLQNAEWVGPELDGITPSVQGLGVAFQDIFKLIPPLMHRGEPENIQNLNKLIARVEAFLNDRAPDLKVLGDALQPKMNSIAGALMNFDTGQLLDNLLMAVPADGTVTLRVVP